MILEATIAVSAAAICGSLYYVAHEIHMLGYIYWRMTMERKHADLFDTAPSADRAGVPTHSE